MTSHLMDNDWSLMDNGWSLMDNDDRERCYKPEITMKMKAKEEAKY